VKTFSVKDISDLFDLDLRLVQFYTKEIPIRAEAGGGKRGQAWVFSENSAIEFGLIKHMVGFGMTVGKIREVINFFRTPAQGMFDRYKGSPISASGGKKKDAYLIFFWNEENKELDVAYNPNGWESMLKDKKLRGLGSFSVINADKIILTVKRA
jgi:hypothetical protein